MGKNPCCHLMAAPCLSKEDCLYKNSLCYWNIKGANICSRQLSRSFILNSFVNWTKLLDLIWQAGISGGGSLPMHVDKFFEVRGPLIYLLKEFYSISHMNGFDNRLLV